MRPIAILLFTLSLASAAQTNQTIQGILPNGDMDREAIKTLYFNGEFQPITKALEHFRKNNPDASREDLIFMYRYLSVVYAANSETRDKAESYMYQLVKLVPDINLLDMYISDSIKALLEKVRAEYYALNQNFLPRDSVPVKQPSTLSVQDSDATGNQNSNPSEGGKKRSGRTWLWWTAGGVAVIGATATFLLMSGQDKPGRPVYNTELNLQNNSVQYD